MRQLWKKEERERNPLRTGFKRNDGKLPYGAKEKRVIVVLMSGEICGDQPISATTPVGWAAKTTRWTLTGWWHDVDQYKLI